MAKAKSIYVCSECGANSPKWQGQCPGCGEWNTLVESVAEKASGHRFESLAPTARLQTLSEIEAREVDRVATGIGEFDRALGGGLVAGLFLREFVGEGITWAHLDIAGPAFNEGGPFGYTPKGGTGSAVRTLVRLAELTAAGDLG